MARRKPPVIADQLLDQLLAGADAKAAFEKNGLLDELKKALAERVLNAEIDHHLETGEADEQRQWVRQVPARGRAASRGF
jgi:putative transposase